MTDEQRRLFPVRAILNDARQHCEAAHGATPADYRNNVKAWHRRNHPECDYFGSSKQVGS